MTALDKFFRNVWNAQRGSTIDPIEESASILDVEDSAVPLPSALQPSPAAISSSLPLASSALVHPTPVLATASVAPFLAVAQEQQPMAVSLAEVDSDLLRLVTCPAPPEDLVPSVAGGRSEVIGGMSDSQQQHQQPTPSSSKGMGSRKGSSQSLSSATGPVTAPQHFRRGGDGDVPQPSSSSAGGSEIFHHHHPSRSGGGSGQAGRSSQFVKRAPSSSDLLTMQAAQQQHMQRQAHNMFMQQQQQQQADQWQQTMMFAGGHPPPKGVGFFLPPPPPGSMIDQQHRMAFHQTAMLNNAFMNMAVAAGLTSPEGQGHLNRAFLQLQNDAQRAVHQQQQQQQQAASRRSAGGEGGGRNLASSGRAGSMGLPEASSGTDGASPSSVSPSTNPQLPAPSQTLAGGSSASSGLGVDDGPAAISVPGAPMSPASAVPPPSLASSPPHQLSHPGGAAGILDLNHPRVKAMIDQMQMQMHHEQMLQFHHQQQQQHMHNRMMHFQYQQQVAAASIGSGGGGGGSGGQVNGSQSGTTARSLSFPGRGSSKNPLAAQQQQQPGAGHHPQSMSRASWGPSSDSSPGQMAGGDTDIATHAQTFKAADSAASSSTPDLLPTLPLLSPSWGVFPEHLKAIAERQTGVNGDEGEEGEAGSGTEAAEQLALQGSDGQDRVGLHIHATPPPPTDYNTLSSNWEDLLLNLEMARRCVMGPVPAALTANSGELFGSAYIILIAPASYRFEKCLINLPPVCLINLPPV